MCVYRRNNNVCVSNKYAEQQLSVIVDTFFVELLKDLNCAMEDLKRVIEVTNRTICGRFCCPLCRD